MIIYQKMFMSFLLFAVGAAELRAGEVHRDARSDLIKVATRYLDSYSKLQHKAGDADGVFIEDVVIPSVVSAIDEYKGKIPSAVRVDVYRFLVAGKSMASEELAILTGTVYRASPEQFCSDMSKQSKPNRQFLVQQASDGLALDGLKTGKVSCP